MEEVAGRLIPLHGSSRTRGIASPLPMLSAAGTYPRKIDAILRFVQYKEQKA
jgi:hypothetical protein